MANEGTMPAPHQHITIRVNRWFQKFNVEYTGTPEQLRSAGIVDAFMEEKIINQRSGAMRDRNGVWFRLSARPKQAAWDRGEKLTLTMAPYPSALLSLPGMREMFPDGVPQEQPKMTREEAENADGASRKRAVGRYQRVVEWVVNCGNVIWPNWPRIAAEAYLATKQQ